MEERLEYLINSRLISTETEAQREAIKNCLENLECDTITRISEIVVQQNNLFINFISEHSEIYHIDITQLKDCLKKTVIIKYADSIYINDFNIDLKVNVGKFVDSLVTEMEMHSVVLNATSQYNSSVLKAHMQRYLILIDNYPVIARFCRVRVTPSRMISRHHNKTYRELALDMKNEFDDTIQKYDWKILLLHWFNTIHQRGFVKLKDITPYELYFSRY